MRLVENNKPGGEKNKKLPKEIVAIKEIGYKKGDVVKEYFSPAAGRNWTPQPPHESSLDKIDPQA